jgi:hypothetical protein
VCCGWEALPIGRDGAVTALDGAEVQAMGLVGE